PETNLAAPSLPPQWLRQSRRRCPAAAACAESRGAGTKRRAVSLHSSSGVQAVAQPAYSFNAAGGQFLAQAAHKDLDGVGVSLAVVRVQVLGQLGAREHFSGALHEQGQDLELVAGQCQWQAID